MKDEFKRGLEVDDRNRDLQVRAKRYALRVIKVFLALEKNHLSLVLGRQILRGGTSVGAHYREAFRARSTAEFISKMEVGLQELNKRQHNQACKLLLSSFILYNSSFIIPHHVPGK